MLETWRIESSPQKQTALSVVVVLAGLVLAYGFRNFDASGMTNSLAGFLLGILLLIIGIPGLLTGGKQTITVDARSKTILIEDKNRFRQKKKYIAFNEISDAHITRTGSYSSRTFTYYIRLKLKSGKSFPLFYPQYYEGRWSKEAAENRLERLKEYLQN